MTTNNLFYSVAPVLPEDAKTFKAASVPAALVRFLAARDSEATLQDVIDGFAASYLTENRELPRSGVLRDNPQLYFFDYLKFLVKEGHVQKRAYAPEPEAEAESKSKSKSK